MDEKKLNELIPAYYTNKERMEGYKKLVDKQNKEIKELFGNDLQTYEIDDYKATVAVSHKVEFDTKRLVSICKEHNIDVVRTTEYVDMDELENKIYHKDIPAEVLKLISSCKNEKEIKTLRVTKKH